MKLNLMSSEDFIVHTMPEGSDNVHMIKVMRVNRIRRLKMAISKTRSRTLKKWMDENNEKGISTIYVEASAITGCSYRGKGDINGLLTGMINVITDLAVEGGVSTEEITGKITGFIAEKKRKNQMA